MREIVIQIPTLESEQNIDIDVTINGKKRKIKYRVEIIDFDEKKCNSEEKLEVIKRVIKEHDKDWQLMQIGAPHRDSIPIMFRQRVIPDKVDEEDLG